jgi:hypothetical protein
MVEVGEGDRIGVGANETISVGAASRVSLVFRGGALGSLCPGSALTFLDLSTIHGDPKRPTAAIELASGAVALSTASSSDGFADLAVTVATTGGMADLIAGPGSVVAAIADGSVIFVSDRVESRVQAWCSGGPDALAGGPDTTPGGSAASASPGATSNGQPTEDPTPGPSPTPPSSAQPSTSAPTPSLSAGPSSPPPSAPASATPTPGPKVTPPPTLTPTPAATPAPTPLSDFTISCSPDELQALPGQDAASTCTITSIGAFNGAVCLACSGLDKVASCTFEPPAPAPAAGGSVQTVLTVRVLGAAKPSCLRFNVIGTAGSLVHRDGLQLDIPSGGGPSC